MSTINSARINDDISSGSTELQVAALKAILHLSRDSFDSPSSIRGLIDAVSVLVSEGTGDILFLGRKALNHLQTFVEEDDGFSSSAQSEMLSREECLHILKNIPDDTQKTAMALSLLIKKGKAEDIETVWPLLSSKDARVRSNAIECIERHGSDREVIEASMPLLADDSNRVRGTVLSILGRLKPTVVVPHFKVMLSSEQLSVRESAVYALSRIKGEWAVKLLITALSDSFEDIRMRAAEGLGRQKDMRALDALASHLDDVSPKVARAVENAIEFLSLEEVQGVRTGELSCAHSFASAASDASFENQYAKEIGQVNALAPEALATLTKVGQELFQRVMDKRVVFQQLEVLYCDIVRLEAFKEQYEKSPSAGEVSEVRSIVENRHQRKESAQSRIREALALRYQVFGVLGATAVKNGLLCLEEDDWLTETFNEIVHWDGLWQ